MPAIDQQLKEHAENLISVSQAAKFTPYSGEYLSLLARTGKLKAFKINRDWITTRQAVLQYVKKQQKKHSNLLKVFEDGERRLV